ncbi:unnamed protein product [Lactuca virosa]|uniref:Uncharacterized protein n=1 Tax=Lactuca virosa TaxID=75947 RepID=A0AAU9MQW5_9ASTR|nr:unnamed protein product [Lactuca virosa]
MMHHHQQKSSSSPPLETLAAPPVQTIAPPSDENNLHETLAAMNILDLCLREYQMKKKHSSPVNLNRMHEGFDSNGAMNISNWMNECDGGRVGTR